MISDFYTKPLQGSQFRKFHAFILNLAHDDRPVGPQECVGTTSATSATTASRVESDDSSVCPAPAASSSPRSYQGLVAPKCYYYSTLVLFSVLCAIASSNNNSTQSPLHIAIALNHSTMVVSDQCYST